MDRPESQKLPKHRIVVLVLLIFAVLACYFTVMFNLQIVHGAEYRSQSVSQIVRTTTVEAARGNIADRNGNLIVGNQQTYTLTFDASLLPDDADTNEAILRLVNLCIENNVAYTDNVPLSADAPFTYTPYRSSTAESNFKRYLEKTLQPWLEKEIEKHRNELSAAADNPKKTVEADPFLEDPALDPANLTAPQLLEAMRRSFDIDETVSDADARKIAAVRWELALRREYATSAYILAENVDINLITLIKNGDYLGADIGLSSARQYETTAAAHLLGYVSAISKEQYDELKDKGYSLNATVGAAGVEAAFEEYLHGTNGVRISNTNDSGKVTSELYTVEPEPGDTVELTIDLEFQEQVEALLAERVDRMTAEDGIARGAAAVVEQIGTGEILAMASYPTYDLSTFRQDYTELSQDPSSPLLNRATMGLYPPGSTLKPLTAIAALEEGVTTTTEKIRDTGKWTYPGDSKSYFYCWKRTGHGLQNITQAITNSCNYFIGEMGYRLGMEKLREYLTAFGLGEKTGIEIGDYAGTLPENPEGQNQAPWAAFGQSNQLYTPLQLANYVATLAGGGERYTPHLLKSVRSYDNSELVYSSSEMEPVETIDIDSKNLEAVLKGMLGYTQPGGQVYSYFKDCVVTAGAKTGTAQLGGKKENNGVFVAFAPYDDPEIAVALVIEKGGSGAALAETAVGILNAYFSKDEIATTIIGENELLR